jgi:His/Glu/Gln/Arg/opine family amino acid ABC transporter permease subunit
VSELPAGAIAAEAPVLAPAAPRAAFGRRLTGWQSLAGTVALLVALPFILRMDPANFQPFQDGGIWLFIAEGVGTTVLAATIAIVLSLPLATLFALGRTAPLGWARWPSIAYVEGFRALPVLLLILYIFFNLPADLARNLPAFLSRELLAVTLALLIYTAALNAETLRAGILALDRGQTEAARSLGLTYAQAMRHVILPQTFRNVLPPLIAQFTTLLKDTSLGSVIGMVELMQRGKILFQGYRNPMETLFVIAVIYFILNFILERISVGIEARRRRARPGAAAAGGAA